MMLDPGDHPARLVPRGGAILKAALGTDLAAALGHVGDPQHPAAVAAIERAAGKAGAALGTISRSWEEALYDRGYQMVTITSDAALLTRARDRPVKRFRDEVDKG